MQNKELKSWFGAFDIVIDESVHVALAFIAATIGRSFGLTNVEAFIVFLTGAFLQDIDHLINVYICRDLIKVKDYKGTTRHSDQGYVPNVLHGFDMAALLSLIVGALTHALVGWTLFLALALHILWDFAVYPHHHSVLFLVHRARRGFKPGKRDYFVGRVFDADTLHW